MIDTSGLPIDIGQKNQKVRCDPSADDYLKVFGAGEGDWGAVMSPLMIS